MYIKDVFDFPQISVDQYLPNMKLALICLTLLGTILLVEANPQRGGGGGRRNSGGGGRRPGNVTRLSTIVEILKILIQNFINKNPINCFLLHKFSIFYLSLIIFTFLY